MKMFLLGGLLLFGGIANAQNYAIDTLAPPTYKINLNQKEEDIWESYADQMPTQPGVVLEVGTAIILETTESMEAETLEVGLSIQFKVQNDVLVEDRIVVFGGTLVQGKITAIEGSTHSEPEEISLELQPLQVVDGQLVPLDGKAVTLRGKYARRALEIEPGMEGTAEVSVSMIIKAN